jgi:hypothetical protein
LSQNVSEINLVDLRDTMLYENIGFTGFAFVLLFLIILFFEKNPAHPPSTAEQRKLVSKMNTVTSKVETSCCAGLNRDTLFLT